MRTLYRTRGRPYATIPRRQPYCFYYLPTAATSPGDSREQQIGAGGGLSLDCPPPSITSAAGKAGGNRPRKEIAAKHQPRPDRSAAPDTDRAGTCDSSGPSLVLVPFGRERPSAAARATLRRMQTRSSNRVDKNACTSQDLRNFASTRLAVTGLPFSPANLRNGIVLAARSRTGASVRDAELLP